MNDATRSVTSPTVTNPEASGAVAWSASEREALDLWTDLVRATRAVRAVLAERLTAEFGMIPEEVGLLMRLGEAPEQRLRMADMSRSMQVSKSGVTRLVDRLVERGLVERAACPSDRRVVYAGLTDEGGRTVKAAAPLLVAGVLEHVADRLGAQERLALHRSLRKILLAERAPRKEHLL
jgi:DNA-binding MarR family transcriptional regulator